MLSCRFIHWHRRMVKLGVYLIQKSQIHKFTKPEEIEFSVATLICKYFLLAMYLWPFEVDCWETSPKPHGPLLCMLHELSEYKPTLECLSSSNCVCVLWVCCLYYKINIAWFLLSSLCFKFTDLSKVPSFKRYSFVPCLAYESAFFRIARTSGEEFHSIWWACVKFSSSIYRALYWVGHRPFFVHFSILTDQIPVCLAIIATHFTDTSAACRFTSRSTDV